MLQESQSVTREAPRAGRRRILEQEAPVLGAIAVLLSAWLVLALSG